jgi:hypothetical protein
MVVGWVLFAGAMATAVLGFIAGKKWLAATGVAVLLFSIAVLTVLLIDEYAVNGLGSETPSFILNVVFVAITGGVTFIGYSAAWCLAWASDRSYHWVESTGSFLGASMLGTLSASFWQYADFTETHPVVSIVADNFLEGLLWVSLGSVVLLIVLILVRARDMWSDLRALATATRQDRRAR